MTFGSHPALLFENPWGCGDGQGGGFLVGIKYNRMTYLITSSGLDQKAAAARYFFFFGPERGCHMTIFPATPRLICSTNEAPRLLRNANHPAPSFPQFTRAGDFPARCIIAASCL